MSGEETARELLSVLSTEYAIASSNLLAVMHDCASVNTVAMQTVKVLYPSVLDIGCFLHTIDHVGEHFSAPTLHDFGILWVSLFSRSPKARVMWKTRTGRSMLSYSQTHWWSRWEVYNQLFALFGDVLPFLEENSVISTATRTKLIALMRDPTKYTLLQIELAATIDVGEQFVKATYKLEGDGHLVFHCYDVLSSLEAGIHVAHLPNLTAVATKLSGGNQSVADQLVRYGRSCVQPGLDYFQRKFSLDLKACSHWTPNAH